MIRPKLILSSTAGHARSCNDVIERQGHFHIASLVGLLGEKNPQQLNYGHLFIGDNSVLHNIDQTYQFILIAIRHLLSASRLFFLHRQALQFDFEFPAVIDPITHVSSHAVVAVYTIVKHGAIVNTGARAGENYMINSCALIEHDVGVAIHCHISTGVTINSSITVD